MSSFEILKPARRVVAKVGSALVTNGGAGIDRSAITRWATDVAALRQRGVEVVFVSSGAVAEGMARLGWKERPKAISELQAAAAVGQMGLVNVYEQAFGAHGGLHEGGLDPEQAGVVQRRQQAGRLQVEPRDHWKTASGIADRL